MKLEIPMENKFIHSLYEIDEDDADNTEDDTEDPDDSWDDE